MIFSPFVDIIVVPFLAASIGFISALAGSLLGGYEGQKFGRKASVLIELILAFSAQIMISFSPNFSVLLIGKTIHGYTYGSLSGLVPIYNSELCQPDVRSITGSFATTLMSMSMTISFILGTLVTWRPLVLISSGFALVNIVLLFFVPESPVWLMLKGKEEEAYETLVALRGDEGVADLEYERMRADLANQIRIEIANMKKDVSKWKKMTGLFRQPSFMKPLTSLIILVILGQELAGFCALAVYINRIIIQTGIPVDHYMLGAVIMTYRTVICIASNFYVPFFRRKVMCTVGSVIIVLGSLTVAISINFDIGKLLGTDSEIIIWLPIVGIFLMYGGYSGGHGHTILCYLGELLPAQGRTLGSGIVCMCVALAMFTISKFVPLLEHAIGLGNVFVIFGVSTVCFLVFVLTLVPETKGKTLEEIAAYYATGKDVDMESIREQTQRNMSVFSSDRMSLPGYM